MTAEKLFADVIFRGSDIVTLDRTNPYIRNGAVAVVGNQIAWIGAAAELDAHVAGATRSLDISGQILIPGLIDGHVHLVSNPGNYWREDDEAARQAEVQRIIEQRRAQMRAEAEKASQQQGKQ